MIVLSINSRGMGSNIKQKAVRDIISQHKVDLICIQETKLQDVDIRRCRQIWGDADFEWRVALAENRGGGLLCIWKNGWFQVERTVIDTNFILLVGKFPGDDSLCCFLNIYAPCDRTGKRQLWNKVKELRNDIASDLWCVAGDFNAVRSSEERRGPGAASQLHRLESEDFNDFIDDMELVDIPLLGRKFTWVRPNGRQMSRLDRFLISQEWLTKWPGFVQNVLPRDISDHCPLLFRRMYQNWGPKPFRVLNCWFDDPRFKSFVEDSWRGIQVEGNEVYVLKEKFKILKQKLKQWNKDTFGNLNRKRKDIVDQLNEIEKRAETADLEEEENDSRKRLSAEFWQCAKQIESLMFQKSRINWIKEGDANTRYFHAVVNFRRKSNSISGLQVNDSWVEDPVAVKEEVKLFFTQKFKSAGWVRPKLEGVPFRSLSDDSARCLESNFSAEEIKEAVWSCAGDKSPGPDSINFRFIKSFWGILEEDFKRMAGEFHKKGMWPRGTNASFICLIPKVDSPLGLHEFRPISLVNCLYKVISKILANRLKSVIPSVIDECQSAFVGGRNMLDSVLVANEVIHEARMRKNSIFALKVDFEKAYDSVEWDFLFYMLRRMNFGSKWIMWIKNCLQSASVSVLVNGSPTGEFNMEKGLRQGDPLAPFLFLIIGEGLSGLMRQARVLNQFSAAKVVGEENVEVPLLQFADDTIFLGEATLYNIFVVKSILRCFELISGLKVNFFKSRIAGVCVEPSWLRSAASILHCQEMKIPFTYLGIPLGGNPRRLAFWDPIIYKIRSRLSKWKQQHLSFGGRVCMIKAVLSSLPLFFLSFFKMPAGVLDKCNSILRRFLWGGTDEQRKVAWVRWNDVCKPIGDGGLGVRDWKTFNWALLGKWRWRLLRETDSLWGRILKVKYGGMKRQNDSIWWKDLCSVCAERNWFNDSVCRRIGDGKGTLFWEENWWGVRALKYIFQRLFLLSSQPRASIFEMGEWRDNVWCWNFSWNRPLFDRELAKVEELKLLLRSFSPKMDHRDTWCWLKDGSGIFSVKSAYESLQNTPQPVEGNVFSKLWKAKAPSNSIALAWRIFLKRIQTKVDLAHRNALPPNSGVECALCLSKEENCHHLFFECYLSWQVWMRICKWLGVSTVLQQVPIANFSQFCAIQGTISSYSKTMALIWIATVGAIWYYRNGAVFRGEEVNVDRIVELIQFRSWLWIKVKGRCSLFSHYDWISQPAYCIHLLN